MHSLCISLGIVTTQKGVVVNYKTIILLDSSFFKSFNASTVVKIGQYLTWSR